MWGCAWVCGGRFAVFERGGCVWIVWERVVGVGWVDAGRCREGLGVGFVGRADCNVVREIYLHVPKSLESPKTSTHFWPL